MFINFDNILCLLELYFFNYISNRFLKKKLIALLAENIVWKTRERDLENSRKMCINKWT